MKENASPEVINFLRKYVPEEAPGSWDDVNNEFVVPYNHEELDYSEDDIEDSLYVHKNITKADLPTEYVEIDNYQVGDQNRPATARNFAKYVPGKGLYYKMTTEPGNGGELNESAIKRMQKLANLKG